MINEIIKKKRGISIVITIWQGITIQGLYCYLDMGNDTVMYYKCSHVPNLFTLHFILHTMLLEHMENLI